MKSCPTCKRTYTDASLNFCLEDGTPLVNEAAPVGDLSATIRYIDPRDTSAPRGEDYRQQVAAPDRQVADRVRPITPPQQWSPQAASAAPRRKSNAVWWVLGGIVVVGIIGIGLLIMILALSSMSTNSNGNANASNSNSRVANRNANANTNTNASNVNSNTNLPASITDDFSVAKWGTGKYEFGEIWYANDEYHMRSKDKTFLVMYAPTDDYNTGNATVRVKARSVDGTPAASGFGLIVHGEKSKSGDLEDYALLIYTGADPQYEVIKHKGGAQTTVVPWTKSKVILTGTSPNKLEVRAKGSELSFYINGEYVDRITDSENFKRGVVGFYTSDTAEVAFDDLEIKR
ncbi:MAG: hypothetical protein M3Y84_12240 [Acidobacteriota bacterium]|nr:hypothetical protein [Acidobacteriota bacterium]